MHGVSKTVVYIIRYGKRRNYQGLNVHCTEFYFKSCPL